MSQIPSLAVSGSPDAPIPVTILTGFLGAGKTTLLRRILAGADGVRYGVLINDFGALNIDADLVVEQADDRVSLANGCVCCSIRDDMVSAIEALVAGASAPDRILIEASGVSRPLAIADALGADALCERVRLEGIFCLVDADGFAELDFAATELALDQAAGSDIVVLNKVDLASEATLSRVEATLRGALPSLRLVRTSHAIVPLSLLFDAMDDAVPGKGAAGARFVHGARGAGDSEDAGHAHGADEHGGHEHHDHGTEFEAWHWQSPGPIDEARFRSVMRDLPTSLMRAKGVLRTGDGGGRLVFHLVGKRRSLEREDEPPPQTSAFVAIGRKGAFDPQALAALLDSCLAAETT